MKSLFLNDDVIIHTQKQEYHNVVPGNDDIVAIYSGPKRPQKYGNFLKMADKFRQAAMGSVKVSAYTDVENIIRFWTETQRFMSDGDYRSK